MSIITVQNLHKNFGGTHVLDDINFQVAEGEFLTIVGPSGCGKSTLLRILAGLERQTEGHVTINGRIVDHEPPYLRNVGMVFQNYALYPHMTVFDNLAFGMMARRVPRPEIRKRVVEVANLLGIEQFLAEKPKILSGGQRQRVAMGRALVRDPVIFLMDEPLSNLDALLRERMRMELRHLHEKLHIPTIYVTHDQTEAMTLADRIAVMKDGKVLQVGTPEQVYHEPQTEFVAKFLGSPPMNIVPVDIAHNRILPVNEPGYVTTLPDRPDLSKISRVSSVSLGFRPEAVKFVAPSHDDLKIPMLVDAIETLGARYHVHGHWGRTPLTVVMNEYRPLKRGQSLVCAIPWHQLHWFNHETESRLPKLATEPFTNLVGSPL